MIQMTWNDRQGTQTQVTACVVTSNMEQKLGYQRPSSIKLVQKCQARGANGSDHTCGHFRYEPKSGIPNAFIEQICVGEASLRRAPPGHGKMLMFMSRLLSLQTLISSEGDVRELVLAKPA